MGGKVKKKGRKETRVRLSTGNEDLFNGTKVISKTALTAFATFFHSFLILTASHASLIFERACKPPLRILKICPMLRRKLSIIY